MWINAAIRDDKSLPPESWFEVPEQSDYQAALIQGLEKLLPNEQPPIVHVSKTNPIGRAVMTHAFDLEYPDNV